MKKNLIFLAILILLYLIPSLILQGVYGDSFGLWKGSERWYPDGNGGWEKQGEPNYLMPKGPSEVVPIGLQFLPLLLPGIVLMLVLLTPLSRVLETKRPTEEDAREEQANADPPSDSDDAVG